MAVLLKKNGSSFGTNEVNITEGLKDLKNENYIVEN